jgi:pyruvate dehydrogenase E1 component alpha subunit
MYDPELYRDKREVEEWKQRDPITLFEAALRRDGLLDDARAAALEASVDAEVLDAVAFANAGTLEPAERLLDDVNAPRAGARSA